MTAWTKGFWIGAALVAMLGIVGGSTRFEGFLRIAGDQIVLDVRGDQSTLGRVINPPIGALGEASLVKRSYVIVSTYDFVLRLRPEIMTESGGTLSGLTISAQLPGTTTATNATERIGTMARWTTIPSDGVMLRTRVILWVPIAVVIAAILLSAFARRI